MVREYIKTGDIGEIIHIMSEGNDTVSELLHSCLLEFDSLWEFIKWILIMDDMNIRGDQLQIIYENYASGDTGKLINSIETRDEKLVELVNAAYVHEERACLGGTVRAGKVVLQEHENEIWLIDTSWEVEYRFGSEAEIVVSDKRGRERISTIRYLNDDFFLIDNTVMHIWQFADMLEKKGYHCVLALPGKGTKYRYMMYHPPNTRRELRRHKKILDAV
ncbi:MAG: hypothetical protein NC089_13375 [Bacteroides sp.]|nr:hypothetical protein [Bacteroides sp.]MCM1550959.1 hypothetical protein [Clostridium sp.]